MFKAPYFGLIKAAPVVEAGERARECRKVGRKARARWAKKKGAGRRESGA